MEGLIPFVYKAIVRYKNGGRASNIGSLLFHDSPSASYVRLPAGDSGRLLSSDVRFFPSSPRSLTAPQSPRRRAAQHPLITEKLPITSVPPPPMLSLPKATEMEVGRSSSSAAAFTQS
ncbi:hypothetical protein BHM03_00000035 [Ensete ventricosum]|uniref:Uncharacterized protein n=1 Tax=Ensete ventricosum TaxID=4639 RepID=A0A445M864_ENSVE|nr:hypothetical protein BHM03_00000035 [Ensete ventricosum]